jgi:hypothetical protein
VELLLAKVYSAWRGHDGDALATCASLPSVCALLHQEHALLAMGALRSWPLLERDWNDSPPKRSLSSNAVVPLHTHPIPSCKVACRYDALISRFPEDYRGYLARGVFLRERGRRADAERMFLQVCGRAEC